MRGSLMTPSRCNAIALAGVYFFKTPCGPLRGLAKRPNSFEFPQNIDKQEEQQATATE